MKILQLLFLLNWLAIAGTMFLLPGLDLLSFDDNAELGFFLLGVVGIIFFIIVHGMLVAFSPKTKTMVVFTILGLAQIAASVMVVQMWLSPDHGEMGFLFVCLYALAAVIISLPFAIAALVQRSRAKRTLSASSL